MTVTPPVDAIDVAHYQHVTDEAAIPALPLMTCKGSEGATYKDPTRPEWLRIFAERGAIRGMYHWIRSDSPIAAQVQNLAECYRQEGALPAKGQLAPGWVVQLDWERTPKVRDLTVAEVEEWTVLAAVEFGPGRQITYCSDWVPGFTEWRDRNPTAPLWYANYRLVDDALGGRAECVKFAADVWQWSSQVMVPGVDSIARPGIDVSQILNMATVRRAAALADPPPPNPQPEDDMITEADIWKDQDVPGDKFVLLREGYFRPISATELALLAIPLTVDLGKPVSKADRDAMQALIPVPVCDAVDQGARDMATRNANAISDIRIGGQRIADAGGH